MLWCLEIKDRGSFSVSVRNSVGCKYLRIGVWKLVLGLGLGIVFGCKYMSIGVQVSELGVMLELRTVLGVST